MAAIIALYVGARVVMQFGTFASAAPFRNRVLRAFFAFGCLVLLGGSFLVVAIFVEHVAS